jgi:hypothetical protein
MAEKIFGNLVKGVKDIRQDILVLDADLYVDQEGYLLNKGSAQEDLWGINLHPDLYGIDDFVEFDSMINIRPPAKQPVPNCGERSFTRPDPGTYC